MEQRDDVQQDDHQDQHHEVEGDNNAQVPLEAEEEEPSSSAEQNEPTVMDTTTSKSPDGEDLVETNEGGNNKIINNDDGTDIIDNNNDDNNDNTENTKNNNNNNLDDDESNNNFNSDELTTPEVVVEQLKSIAESGNLHVDWQDLQRALKIRLSNVLDHYIEKNRDSAADEQYQEPNVEKFNLEHSRNELFELISSFAEPPFTIQRICELLYNPFKYYDKISTFLRGLEKNLRVISPLTRPKIQVEPTPKDDSST